MRNQIELIISMTLHARRLFRTLIWNTLAAARADAFEVQLKSTLGAQYGFRVMRYWA